MGGVTNDPEMVYTLQQEIYVKSFKIRHLIATHIHTHTITTTTRTTRCTHKSNNNTTATTTTTSTHKRNNATQRFQEAMLAKTQKLQIFDRIASKVII